jgi:TM2 domain-containing membrane protein YozV
MPGARPARSKTLATWLAVLGGSLGLHRFYLHGPRDAWAWLHPAPTLAGLVGIQRLRAWGQDDMVAWVLLPLLGLMVVTGMTAAIVIGLTPDERFAARFRPGAPVENTRWGPVLGVITALMVGGAALMSVLAYGGQKFFEWQALRQQVAHEQPAPAVGTLRTTAG